MLETSVRWGPLLKEGNQPLEPKLFDVPEVAAFQHEDTKSTEEHEDGIYLYFVFFVSSCLRVFVLKRRLFQSRWRFQAG